MNILSEKDILHALIGLNGWSFQDNSLRKIFTFDSYMQSIEFINRVAEKAEEAKAKKGESVYLRAACV